MTEQGRILEELNDRSREVFRRVVEGYLETGAPVGSRTLTRSLSEKVSAATVRNVMQDLSSSGLLGSPHTSAGRVPTQLGCACSSTGSWRSATSTARQPVARQFA
jgi:heat-inducible transcriptional repressor